MYCKKIVWVVVFYLKRVIIFLLFCELCKIIYEVFMYYYVLFRKCICFLLVDNIEKVIFKREFCYNIYGLS